MSAVSRLKAGLDRLTSTQPLGSDQGEQARNSPLTAKAGSPSALEPEDRALRIRPPHSKIEVLPVPGEQPATWRGYHRRSAQVIEEIELASETVSALIDQFDHSRVDVFETAAWTIVDS